MKCMDCGKEIKKGTEFDSDNFIASLTLPFFTDKIVKFANDNLPETFEKKEKFLLDLSQNTEEIFICNKCIEGYYKTIMANISNIKSDNDDEKSNFEEEIIPKNMFNHLSDFIIGQDKAKKVIATEIYNHYKRAKQDKNSEVQLEKNNIMLVGPTGSGKTYIVRTIAKILNIPCVIEDATTITAKGYVGRDVDDVLRSLILEAKGDLEKAEKGIIYIDEIDKLGKSSPSNSASRDISGEEVQKEFLKMIECGKYRLNTNNRDNSNVSSVTEIDTSNILFIVGGAFEGIDNIIKDRIDKDKSSIGFCSVPKSKKEKFSKEEFNKYINQIKTEDIKKYGMSREFVGRFSKIAPLEELTVEQLRKILEEPKNSIIKQYKLLFELDEVELIVEDEALLEIAKKTKEEQTGARALKMIMNDILFDAMFDVPSNNDISKVIITKDLSVIYKKRRKTNKKNKIVEGV